MFSCRKERNNTLITVRQAHERGKTQTPWLESYHTVSFNRYYDPRYTGFDDRSATTESSRRKRHPAGLILVGMVSPQHLLHKRETDAKHIGQGALEAQLPLVGLHNPLTSSARIRCHRCKTRAAAPDDQAQTAVCRS